MKSSPSTFLKTWGILLVTFILGGLAGGGLARLLAPPFLDPHEFRVTDLEKALELTPEQAPKVRAVIEDLRRDYSGICAEVRPRYDEAREAARVRMRSLLTPAQQAKFDQLIPMQECSTCPKIVGPDEQAPTP
jgi:hypothetical protein